jgi:flagellar biogenesis protein FliO
LKQTREEEKQQHQRDVVGREKAMKSILLGGWFVLCWAVLGAEEIPLSEAGVSPLPLEQEVKKEAKFSTQKIPQKTVDDAAELFKEGKESTLQPSFESILSVMGCLLFMICVAVYLKRKRTGTVFGKIVSHFQLLSSLKIPGAQLCLVRLGDKIYVLAVAEKNVTCLDTIEDLSQLASLTSKKTSQTSFQDEYASMIKKMSVGTSRAMEEASAENSNLSGELEQLKKRLKEIV